VRAALAALRKQHHRGKGARGAGAGTRGAEVLRGSRAFRNIFGGLS
jgi:hypothetical protein